MRATIFMDYLSLARSTLRATNSITLYTLDQVEPAFGVGLTATNAEAAEIAAEAHTHQACDSSRFTIISVITIIFNRCYVEFNSLQYK